MSRDNVIELAPHLRQRSVVPLVIAVATVIAFGLVAVAVCLELIK